MAVWLTLRSTSGNHTCPTSSKRTNEALVNLVNLDLLPDPPCLPSPGDSISTSHMTEPGAGEDAGAQSLGTALQFHEAVRVPATSVPCALPESLEYLAPPDTCAPTQPPSTAVSGAGVGGGDLPTFPK
jgi:hypothetical protein